MSCTRRTFLLPKIEHKAKYPVSNTRLSTDISNKLISLWRDAIETKNVISIVEYLNNANIKNIFHDDALDFIGYFLELMYQQPDNKYLLDLPRLRTMFSIVPIDTMSYNLRSGIINQKSLNRVLNVCIELKVNPFILVFFNIASLNTSQWLSLLGYQLFAEYQPYNELVDMIISNRFNDSEKNPSGVYIGENKMSTKRELLIHNIYLMFDPIYDLDSENMSVTKSPLINDIKQAINRLFDFLIDQRQPIVETKTSVIPSQLWSPIQKSKNYEANIINIFGGYMSIFEQIQLGMLPTNRKALGDIARNYFADQKISADTLLTMLLDGDFNSILMTLGFFAYLNRYDNLYKKLEEMTKEYYAKTQEAKNEYTIMLYERLLYLLFLCQSQEHYTYQLGFGNLIQNIFKYGIINNGSPDRSSTIPIDEFETYIPFESEAFIRRIFLNNVFEYLGEFPSLFYTSFFSEEYHRISKGNFLLPMYTLEDYQNIARCLTYFKSYYYDSRKYTKLYSFMMDIVILEMTMKSNSTMEHIQMLKSIKHSINDILT